MLTGCVDDDYDLSDVDTTTRLSVNDLTLPVNIDAVKLSDIITYDDESKIKPISIEGTDYYALIEDGEFNSDAIYVEKVTAAAPTLNPSNKTLTQVESELGTSAGVGAATYAIVDMGNQFTYNAGKIDDAIVSLDAVECDGATFQVHLEALNVGDKTESIVFSDLVISMPKGMTASTTHGEYDPVSGIWTISRYDVQGTTGDASLTATAIDFSNNDVVLDANHRFTFSGDFIVKSGNLTIVPKSVGGAPATLPENLEFRVTYKMSDLTASAFDGVISYKLDGMNIDPISLSDLPDFLTCEGTNIKLANPQIYLSLNNPVADNALDISTGLTLTAIRDNAQAINFSPSKEVYIGHSHSVSGPYNYVLAPENSGLVNADKFAANREFIQFATLGDLLAAPASNPNAGIPESIDITLNNPQIPTAPVKGFKLGRNITGVKGVYELVAPLQLEEGSVIIYTDTEDGWNDEDVDALTITKLVVNAEADNTIPMSAQLYAYPIDVNGNRIQGVEVKSSYLESNTSGQVVLIEMTGTITHLDGVIFEAYVYGDDAQTPLAPSQSITLHAIRATVSGYYEKEL